MIKTDAVMGHSCLPEPLAKVPVTGIFGHINTVSETELHRSFPVI